MLADYRRLPKLVYVLCLGTILNRCGYFIVTFLSIYVNFGLGLGPELATWAVGCFGLGSLTAAFIGGHLADTIGRKKVALMALTGSALMAIALSRFRSPTGVLSGVFLFALLNDMYRPAVSAMLTDCVDPGLRPTAFGLLYLAINFGAAVAPIIGGLLAGENYALLFWADAATSLGYAAVIALAVPETLRKKPDMTHDTHPPSTPQPGGFRAVLRDRLFLRICAATLFVSLTYVQAMSTLPIYLGELGIGPQSYGRLIAINGAMIVLFQLFVTRVVSRFDRGIILSLAALVTAIGFGATTFAVSVPHFAATIVIWTVGEMMQSPVLPTVAAELAPTHLRARYFGTITMCFSGANLLAASVSGVILARLGGQILWALSFCVALIGAMLYASSIPALRRRHDRLAPALHEQTRR